MPAEAVVIVSGVAVMFGLFMVVLGGVWVWSNQKPR